MIDGKKCVAVIPAREGSKGIKEKNIKELNGKPLIAYSIELALNSDLIDHTIVSTDSLEYAKIATRFGAEVPFIRPKELAQDNSKGMDVVLHSINWIKKNIINADYYFYLQPTSPLRIPEDLINIINLYKEKNACTIVSVCEVIHPPQWIYSINEDLKLKNIFKVDITKFNRQDFEKYYILNGSYYFSSISFLTKNKSFYSKNTYAYIMPRIRSIDIDSDIDFMFAEFLIKNRDLTQF